MRSRGKITQPRGLAWGGDWGPGRRTRLPRIAEPQLPGGGEHPTTDHTVMREFGRALF